MILALDRILGWSVHPPGIDDVHPDPPCREGAGKVPGQRHQGPFGGAVASDERRPAVSGDRADIDDRTLDLVFTHVADHALDEKEGGPNVGCNDPVKEIRGRIPYRVPIGQGGGIDEGVDRPKTLFGFDDDSCRRVGLRQVGGNKQRLGAQGTELGRSGRALFPVATHDGDPPQSAGNHFFRGGQAQALGTAGDDGGLVVCEERHRQPSINSRDPLKRPAEGFRAQRGITAVHRQVRPGHERGPITG